MTTKFPYCRWLTVSFAALGLLGVITVGGCGGGVQDPTEVALKPNKEETKGGSTEGNGGSGGGPTQNGSPDSAAKAGIGSIKGKVVLASGDAIPSPSVKVAKGANVTNKEFCAKDAILDDSLLINRDNRGVANVFIYLSKAPKGGKDTTTSQQARPTIFDQKGCMFVPHTMVMMTGKQITVKSQDPVPHNVHNYPKGRNDTFNTVIDPANKDGIPLTYENPEIVPCTVKCDFHNWMSAYHLPLDHPYAAVTDENGEFTISDLPSGTHQFVIWHEGKGYLERRYPFTVTADETNDVGEIPFGLNRFAQGEFRGPKPRVVNISLVQK